MPSSIKQRRGDDDDIDDDGDEDGCDEDAEPTKPATSETTEMADNLYVM